METSEKSRKELFIEMIKKMAENKKRIQQAIERGEDPTKLEGIHFAKVKLK